MSNELLIGWEEIDITPDINKKPVGLSGQYYSRRCTAIHSRLKCTVCVMTQGNEMFIEGGIDNVGCPNAFHNMVREAIAKREPSIDVSKVFLHAIHTHTGPKLDPGRVGVSNNWKNDVNAELSGDEYRIFVSEKIADAIVKAWTNRKPGQLQRAFTRATIGHCRRSVYADGTAEMYGDTTRSDFIGMETGEDSGVELLFTLDSTGKKTGLFLNVACPSQVMEATYLISSDFAGATRELLKENFGPEFRTIYQISPAGCQSPRDLVRHYASEPDFWHADGVDFLARRLRDAVLNPCEVHDVMDNPVLKVVSTHVSLPKRRASYSEYSKAQKEIEHLTSITTKAEAFESFCAETLAKEAKGGPGPYDSKLHPFVLFENAEAVIRRYETQDAKPMVNFDMLTIRIGDIAIATSPFELYLYYGQMIKARSHAQQTFLVELAIGADEHAGYLPTPDAEKFGGYGGCIINGTVGSDGGFKLVDTTVKSINELF